jgi:hypothetical protein
MSGWSAASASTMAGGALGLAASASASGPAHQRRGIVEQHQHRAFGGAEIVGRKIGVEIGAGQCACCFGPLAGRRGAHPIEKIADDNCSLARSSVLLATKASTTLADSWRGGIPKSVFL